LDHRAWRGALVGIFHLRAELARAEIKLGANVGLAQRRDHLLIVGDAILIEHGDDNGTRLGLGVELLQARERIHQARNTDGDAGRRDIVGTKAPDQAVIAPTARNRAEPHRPAILARDRRSQLALEYRAGIVFEAAHDGRIDRDLAVAVLRG